MNIEQITAWARESNRYATNQTNDSHDWHKIRDERFAALVAAEIGIEAHRRGYESGLRDGTEAIKDAPDYKMGYADGVAVEREACLELAKSYAHNNTDLHSAIRARSNT